MLSSAVEHQFSPVNLIFLYFSTEIFEFVLNSGRNLDAQRGTWTGRIIHSISTKTVRSCKSSCSQVFWWISFMKNVTKFRGMHRHNNFQKTIFLNVQNSGHYLVEKVQNYRIWSIKCLKFVFASLMENSLLLRWLYNQLPNQKTVQCVKSVQIRSFFWSVFFCIRIECGDLRIFCTLFVFGHFSGSG